MMQMSNHVANRMRNPVTASQVATGWPAIAAFIVLASIAPPELTTFLAGVYIYLSFLFGKRCYIQGWSRILVLLSAMFVVGAISGFLKTDFFLAMKDCWYFLKPVEFLVLGAYLASRASYRGLVRAILIAGAIVSTFHVFRLLTNSDASDSSLDSVRDNVGHGYMISTLALSVALFYLLARKVSFTGRIFCLSISGLTFISHFSAYSRILWIFAAILLLCFVGVLTRLSVRSLLFVIGILCVGIVVALTVSGSKEGSDDATQSLVTKFSNSFNEVNIQDYDDVEEINNNWRGYESFVALRQYSEGDVFQLLMGQGFGSAVDLGINITLGGERTSSAPITHNGFVYVIFKIGVIGTVIYILFFFSTLKKCYEIERFYRNAPRNISGTLAVAIGWTFVATALFITGIFNKSIVSSLIIVLGCIFAMHARQQAASKSRHAGSDSAGRSDYDIPTVVVPGIN